MKCASTACLVFGSNSLESLDRTLEFVCLFTLQRHVLFFFVSRLSVFFTACLSTVHFDCFRFSFSLIMQAPQQVAGDSAARDAIEDDELISASQPLVSTASSARSAASSVDSQHGSQSSVARAHQIHVPQAPLPMSPAVALPTPPSVQPVAAVAAAPSSLTASLARDDNADAPSPPAARDAPVDAAAPSQSPSSPAPVQHASGSHASAASANDDDDRESMAGEHADVAGSPEREKQSLPQQVRAVSIRFFLG